MDDDDPYGHADLDDVIRQNAAVNRRPDRQPDVMDTARGSYPITSPEWRPGEGHDRCDFRMRTGDGKLQCTFRFGHPPHGHSLNAKNPGTPYPKRESRPVAEEDEVAAALFDVLSAFSPVSSHSGTRLGWTISLPVTEDDYNRWIAALNKDGS